MKSAGILSILASCTSVFSAAAQEAPPDQAAELAKKLQNPVASLISFPLQSNLVLRIGEFNEFLRYNLTSSPSFRYRLAVIGILSSARSFPTFIRRMFSKAPPEFLKRTLTGSSWRWPAGRDRLDMCRTALGIPYRVFSSLPKNPSPAGFLPP